MGQPLKFTEEKRARFLACLEQTGEITAAAAVAGISRQTAYDTANREPAFAEAIEAALGRLDEERLRIFRKLAIEGVEKVTYDKDGNVAARTRVFSERLLLAWIKRHKPQEWGEKIQVDQTTTERRELSVRDIPREARLKLREALAALPEPDRDAQDPE